MVKNIKIGYKDYQIVEKEKPELDGKPCYGIINYDDEVIELCTIPTQHCKNPEFFTEILEEYNAK